MSNIDNYINNRLHTNSTISNIMNSELGSQIKGLVISAAVLFTLDKLSKLYFSHKDKKATKTVEDFIASVKNGTPVKKKELVNTLNAINEYNTITEGKDKKLLSELSLGILDLLDKDFNSVVFKLDDNKLEVVNTYSFLYKDKTGLGNVNELTDPRFKTKLVHEKLSIIVKTLGQAFSYLLYRQYTYNETYNIKVNNYPIGYIALRGKEGEDGTVHIEWFMIDDLFQNGGYGKQAFIIILNALKDAGIKYVELDVPESQEAAKHIYKSFGFVVNGETEPNEYAPEEWLKNLTPMRLDMSTYYKR